MKERIKNFRIVCLTFLALALCMASVFLFTVNAERNSYAETTEQAESAHVDHTDWTEFTADTALADGGRYYLVGDVTKNLSVPAGISVTLCLNGFTLTGTGSTSVIKVNGSFTLCDCHAEEEQGKITGGSASSGGGVYVDGGNFTMDGGVITENSSTKTSGAGGAGVYLVNGAQFVMNGGSIDGNTSEGNGGGIYAHGDKTTFIMNGGSIKNNVSKRYGAGVTLDGTMTLNNGVIENNRCETAGASFGGGGISVAGTASLNVVGGSITNNYSKGRGGGVYDVGEFVMSGGKIENNTCDFHGGGVFVGQSKTFTVTGGSITNNTANLNGGGVYLDTSTTSKLVLENGVISYNTANATGSDGYGGGGVYAAKRTSFEMKSGEISHNVTSKYGGGIYAANETTVIISSGSVFQNEALSGGGIRVANADSQFTMDGGELRANKATQNGGAIGSVGIVELNGGNVTDNTAEQNGSSFSVEGGSFLLSDEVTVNDVSQSVMYAAKSPSLTYVTSQITEQNVVITEYSYQGEELSQKILDEGVSFKTENTELYGYTFTTRFAEGIEALWVKSIVEGQVNSAGHYVLQLSNSQSGATVTKAFTVYGLHIDGDKQFDIILNAEGGTLASGNYFIIDDELQLNNDLIVPEGATVTLCLNGKTLRGTSNGSVITVSGSLILCDCSADGQGKITGGLAVSGGGIRVNGGYLEMNGGVITENASTGGDGAGGGGVYVNDSARFVMNGGAITLNTSNADGGGVYAKGQNSVFTLNNGLISQNEASRYGGGVAAEGKMTFNDGVVSLNKLNRHITFGGGGISVFDTAELIMNGGEVTQNETTAYGGGILVRGKCTLSGSVTNNKSAQSGGGVHYNGQALILKGSVTIKGNTLKGNDLTENNLFIYGDKSCSAQTLAVGSNVGISHDGTARALITNLSDGDEEYFVLDNALDEESYHFCNYQGNLVYGKHKGGAATCQSKAVCSVCNAAYGNLAAHSYGEPVFVWENVASAALSLTCSVCSHNESVEASVSSKITVRPTCISEGEKEYTAAARVQNTTYTDVKTEKIGVTDHTLNSVSAKEPTCEEAGNVAHYLCSVCGKKFADANGTDERTDVSRNPIGHNYGTVWVSNGDGTHSHVCLNDSSHKSKAENCLGGTATCLKQAECTECGQPYGGLGEHTGGSATCSAPAVCEICSQPYGAANGEHKWLNEWVPVGSNGHAHLCEYNAEHVSEVVAHTPNRSEPTEDLNVVCVDCGYEISPALGHRHVLTKVDGVAASCTNGGTSAYYTCGGCELWFSDAEGLNVIEDHSSVIIAALGHDLVTHQAKAATCEEAGWDEYAACSRCDYSAYVEIAALGHEWGQWQRTSEPTCTEEGTDKRSCSRCQKEESKSVAKDEAAHLWNDGAITVPATCSSQGVKTYVCLHNGEHTKTENIPIDETAHSFGEWQTVTNATEEQTGLKERECSYCGEKESQVIAKLPKQPDKTDAETPKQGLSAGVIAAIAAGSAAAVAAATVSVVLIVRKKRKNK